MSIAICYFRGIIECTPGMDEQIHGGCTFVDLYAVAIFIIQLVCIFVSIMAMISMQCKVNSKLMMPTIWYCVFQAAVAAISSIYNVASGVILTVLISPNYLVCFVSFLYLSLCVIGVDLD